MFGQTFELRDLLILALLVVLEGALSIDNALVIGLLARRLPHALRGRALSYGLIGAIVLRLLAVIVASYLLEWHVLKLLGGLYLLYVALSHLLRRPAPHPAEGATSDADSNQPQFWRIVFMIELTDLAFAADSILAAVALVGAPPKGLEPGAGHPKLWIVYFGGMIGVALMRVAGLLILRLLDRFPRLETSAYLIVAIIGTKLLLEWWLVPAAGAHGPFEDVHSPLFWAFWTTMIAALLPALVPARPPDRALPRN